jgi:hypothetical protein
MQRRPRGVRHRRPVVFVEAWVVLDAVGQNVDAKRFSSVSIVIALQGMA